MSAATTIRVPAAFARELLADWRVPPEDDERESITDPDQIAFEAELDTWQGRWMTELDGPADRMLLVPLDGPCVGWLRDELEGSVLDGLTWRLPDGSPRERRSVVEALAGWVKVVALLDEANSGSQWLCPACGQVIAGGRDATARPPTHEHYGRTVALIERAPL